MQTESNHIALNRLDKAGIICSGACAIHCLLIPVIAYSSPFIAKYFQNEMIHTGLLVVLIPIALINFTRSSKIHGNNKPLLIGILGIVLLVVAVLVESLHIEIPYLEKSLTGIGSLLLIAAHTINLKSLK